MLSYAVRHLHCSAGIVISASHNTQEYNGIKCYGADGGQMVQEPAAKVSAMQRRSWDGAETATAWPSLAQEKQSARKVNKNSSKSAKRRFKIITSGSILRSRRTKKTNLYDR